MNSCHADIFFFSLLDYLTRIVTVEHCHKWPLVIYRSHDTNMHSPTTRGVCCQTIPRMTGRESSIMTVALWFYYHESLVNHHEAPWLVNADAIWLVDDCQIFSSYQPAQFSYITKLKFLIENTALLTIEWELLKNHDILTILKEFGWIIDPGSSLLSCDYIYLAEFAMQLHFRIYNSCSFFFLFSFFFFFFCGWKMVFQGHNYISCLSTLNDINNSQLFWSWSLGILVIKTIFTSMEQTNHVQTKQTIIILPASIKFIQ